MTPSEFKAWFDGFTEALDGVPSKEQWARIKKRVGEIDGRPVTERVYVNRYVERYWPRYVQDTWKLPAVPMPVYCASGAQRPAVMSVINATAGSHHNSFDSHDAMLALGRAEAASLS